MSSSLKTLEDLGYEVFDNFPLPLLTELIKGAGDKPVAIGIDSRTRDFDPEGILSQRDKHRGELVFLSCSLDQLQQRFTETRRRHPQAADRPVRDGILYEEQLLAPLRNGADHIIDTTDLSVHDLRRLVESRYRAQGTGGLSITLMSFGFKHGVPREADMVMDVRFLQNPHWIAELKPQTGHDGDVGEYIEEDPAYFEFTQKFHARLTVLIPRYHHEGKHYLTIAIGCTGGRHRSVFISETLKKWLDREKMPDITVKMFHRDLKT